MKDAKTVTEIQGILWNARMDAAANTWHLANRAIPPIKELADRLDDSRLPQTIEDITKAQKLLAEARDILGSAIDVIEQYATTE